MNGERELAGHVAAVQRVQRLRQFMHGEDLADLGMDASPGSPVEQRGNDGLQLRREGLALIGRRPADVAAVEEAVQREVLDQGQVHGHGGNGAAGKAHAQQLRVLRGRAQCLQQQIAAHGVEDDGGAPALRGLLDLGGQVLRGDCLVRAAAPASRFVPQLEQDLNLASDPGRGALEKARLMAQDAANKNDIPGMGAAIAQYDQALGGKMPQGDVGREYYNYLGYTDGGLERAIQGLRRLDSQQPGNPAIQLQLAQHMARNERTRAEGIRRLGHLYAEQNFNKGVTMAEVSQSCQRMLDDLLAGRDAQLLDNPNYRLNIMVVKSHGLLADDHRGRLGLGLSSVIADNLRGRARLSRHFERLIIHDPRQAPPVHPLKDFASRFIDLELDNLRQRLSAAGVQVGELACSQGIPPRGPRTTLEQRWVDETA